MQLNAQHHPHPQFQSTHSHLHEGMELSMQAAFVMHVVLEQHLVPCHHQLQVHFNHLHVGVCDHARTQHLVYLLLGMHVVPPHITLLPAHEVLMDPLCAPVPPATPPSTTTQASQGI